MTGISRALLLRDRMLGRVRPVVEGSGPEAIVERQRLRAAGMFWMRFG